jgi:hypothetical protein
MRHFCCWWIGLWGPKEQCNENEPQMGSSATSGRSAVPNFLSSCIFVTCGCVNACG